MQSHCPCILTDRLPKRDIKIPPNAGVDCCFRHDLTAGKVASLLGNERRHRLSVPSHCEDRLIRKIIWARLLADTEHLEPVASQLLLVSYGHPEIPFDILLRHDDGTQHDAGKSDVRDRHTHKARSQTPPAQ